MMKLSAWLPDVFVLALLAAIGLAWIAPVRGTAATIYEPLTLAAIALLFFLHGAKLSRTSIVGGIGHWRLHLAVLATTFIVFPMIGIATRPLFDAALTPALTTGVLYLCTVPSTVSSSIAFTSIAGGNVPAAVCSASLSNMLGVVLTPVLAGVLLSLGSEHVVSPVVVGHIALELVLPFVLGQVCRRWIGGWIGRHPRVVRFVDQGSIVFVVYGVFSASVVAGLWRHTPLSALGVVAGIDVGLLALVLALTGWLGRRLFARADEIVLVFCGSKKTLAGGIPIAKVLFASGPLGAVIVPLMVFHQLQLLACAVIARRYGARLGPSAQPDTV